MKAKFNVLVFALIASSFAAFADAPASMSVLPATNAQVFHVFYKGAEAGKVKVSIINSDNKVVFTEMFYNVSSFRRPYNFSQLPAGTYTIVLEDKNGQQVQTINHEVKKNVSYIKITEVTSAANKYVLQINSTGKESVFVRIFDNNSSLLHEQKIEVNGNYGLVYNLTPVKSASNAPVTFEVSTTGGTTEVISF